LPQGGGAYLIEDIPFKETREYVQKVLKSYRIYAQTYDEGHMSWNSGRLRLENSKEQEV
jgi:hypothetical protein